MRLFPLAAAFSSVALCAALMGAACGPGDTTPVGGSSSSSTGTSSGTTSAPGTDGGSAPHGDAGASSSSSSGPSPGNCYPTPGQTGNDKNVGAYCSKAGGQCGSYGNLSLQCSSDLSAQGGNFCLIVGCAKDGDCGQDGCCSGPAGSIVRACIPIGCFDAGVCNIVAPPGSD